MGWLYPETSWRDGRRRTDQYAPAHATQVVSCAVPGAPSAHAASLIRTARRARTASARLSSTASELSQPMQPSVTLWP